MKKIIRIYHLNILLFRFSFMLHATSYVIFLQSFDLSLTQINMVNFAFMVTVFLLEIPTGLFADIYGRRKSYLNGLLIIALGFLLYFLANSFWIFILAETVVALGSCLISGAFDAWLISKLNHLDESYDLKKIFTHNNYFSLLGNVLGGMIGAYIADFNLAWPWLGSSILLFITFIVGKYTIKEYWENGNSLKDNIKQLNSLSKTSFNIIFKQKNLFLITILIAMVALTMQPLNMFWQPFFNATFPIKYLGFIWVGIKIMIIIGIYLAGKISHQNILAALFYSQLQVVGMILLVVFTKSDFIILTFFLLHEIGRGMLGPLERTYLNDKIKDDNKRATVISISSMFRTFGAALGLILSGIIADQIGIINTWVSFAIILLIAILVLFPYRQVFKNPA